MNELINELNITEAIKDKAEVQFQEVDQPLHTLVNMQTPGFHQKLGRTMAQLGAGPGPQISMPGESNGEKDTFDNGDTISKVPHVMNQFDRMRRKA